MSGVIWPVGEDFPQYPLRVGYREVPPSVVERIQMDTGPDKVAVVATAGWRQFNCSYYFDTQGQQNTFQDFWINDIRCGQDSFTWTHPRTGLSTQAEFDGYPKTVNDTTRFYVTYPMGFPAGNISDTWITTVSIRHLETVAPTGVPATWPLAGLFPQYPRHGTSMSYPGDVITSDVRQRQRSIARPVVNAFSLVLTDVQLSAFDTFFVTECGTGAETFALDIPSQQFEWGYRSSGVHSAKCRFVGTPVYEEVSTHYRVSGNIEWLQG